MQEEAKEVIEYLEDLKLAIEGLILALNNLFVSQPPDNDEIP